MTHKTGASVESRLAALEERCLLELTDSRQRMALEDLRALRAELSGVSPEDGPRQLKDFETQWLKGAHR